MPGWPLEGRAIPCESAILTVERQPRLKRPPQKKGGFRGFVERDSHPRHRARHPALFALVSNHKAPWVKAFPILRVSERRFARENERGRGTPELDGPPADGGESSRPETTRDRKPLDKLMIEVQLNSVKLPEFGPPTVEPVIAHDVGYPPEAGGVVVLQCPRVSAAFPA